MASNNSTATSATSNSITSLSRPTSDPVDGALPATHQTPIHNLSFDILYTIFHMSYDMVERFAIVASHVCQRWRSLAINSGALWAKISFVHPERRWEKHETWLSRSQEAPLTISLTDAAFEQSGLEELSRFLDLILPHAARWVSISFNRVHETLLRVGFSRIRLEKLPMLKVIDVRSYRFNDKERWHGFLHGTPSLYQLVLKHAPFDYSSFSFNDLTELTIEHSQEGVFPTYHHAISLLRTIFESAPGLHTLRFGIYGLQIPEIPTVAYQQPVSPTVQVHRGLRVLNFYPSYDLLDLFLREVQAPSLHSILWYQDLHWNTSISILPVFAQWPMPCNLTHMTFDNRVASTGARANEMMAFALPYLPAALAVLSGLEQLEFSHVDFGDQRRLECLGGLCPRLRKLGLDYCKGVSPEELLEVVARRIETDGFQPLKRLNTCYYQRMTSRTSKAAMTSWGYRMVSSGFHEFYVLDDE